MNNIISCNIEKNDYAYRLGVLNSVGSVEDILVTADGVYTICYEDVTAKLVTETGKITKVISNASKLDSYIEFDNSYDNSNRHKRIYFYKIKSIKDVTPNNAYVIAVKHGFIGTEEEWINKMRYGKSAYEVAVDNGFVGTEKEWLLSILPVRGVDYYTESDQEDLKNDITEKVNAVIGDVHDDVVAKQELAAQSESNALTYANEANASKEAAENSANQAKGYADTAEGIKNATVDLASNAEDSANKAKEYMDSTEGTYNQATALLDDIDAKHTIIVNDITEGHSAAVSDIADKHSAAVSDIVGKHSAAISDIDGAHSDAVTDITTKHSEAIEEMTSIHEQAVSDINSNYNDHITNIQNSADSALTDISKKRAKVLSDIENKTDECSVVLDNKTSDCVTDVEDKRDDLIQDISTKSQEVMTNLEARGEEILEGVVNATNVCIPKKGVDYFDGEKGESGVYVGSGEMPEGYNVQIDPDDDGSGGDVLATLLTDVYNMMNDIKAIKQFIGMTD